MIEQGWQGVAGLIVERLVAAKTIPANTPAFGVLDALAADGLITITPA
jgi:hypothetical protein